MISDVFENSEAAKMPLSSLWPPPIVGTAAWWRYARGWH